VRPYVRVRTLAREEYEELKRMERRRKLAAGKVKRAKIILLSNQGHTTREIAEKLGCHERTASRWINRFNRLGMVGLEEGPRDGRPRVYSPEDVGLIIQTALTLPDDLDLPFGSWTLDRLVAYLSEHKGVGMKRTRVAEVLGREGLRWRKQEGWFGERVDPEFAAKRGPSSASTHALQATPS
jgi:transposase